MTQVKPPYFASIYNQMLAIRLHYDIKLPRKKSVSQHSINPKSTEDATKKMLNTFEIFSHDSFKDILKKIYIFNVSSP